MAPELNAPSPRRVALVTNEVRGFFPVGGLGTATTFLAVALARMGHLAEILYYGVHPIASIDPYWQQFYEQADVRIRAAPACDEPVEPWHFGRMRAVELALRADPPDVVVTQDLGAPAYSALRLRHLGLALESTLFVVYCHGSRRWVTDMSRQVGVKNLPDLLGVNVLEQASLALADVVVSPSAYHVEWMRGQGWQLPERTLVIPYFTRSGATGEPPAKPARVDGDDRVQRLAFFGRLEEKKGLKPFAAGLNALEPELLAGLELDFLGKPTPAWTPDRVEALLSDTARESLRQISFQTDLDQPAALARLGRPGTLAVMPSLAETFGNTVYECLEHGIPFVASNATAIPELVAPEDRARVLFEPTPEGVEQALRRALSGGDALRPARAASNAAMSRQGWADVVAMRPGERSRSEERVTVDVVVRRGPNQARGRCLSALERQSHADFGVIVETTRAAGLRAAEAAWVVFLDEDDVPEPELLETLVQAQQASGADVITCGLYLVEDGGPRSLHLFAGEPAGLGVLSNGYGNVALLRRSLLGELTTAWPIEGDADWPLLARLSVSGARIVSVPLPLVTRPARPGAIDRHPSDALLVLEHLERALPDPLRSVARLAAGLAADSQRSSPAPGFARRARRVLRRLPRGGR